MNLAFLFYHNPFFLIFISFSKYFCWVLTLKLNGSFADNVIFSKKNVGKYVVFLNFRKRNYLYSFFVKIHVVFGWLSSNLFLFLFGLFWKQIQFQSMKLMRFFHLTTWLISLKQWTHSVQLRNNTKFLFLHWRIGFPSHQTREQVIKYDKLFFFWWIIMQPCNVIKSTETQLAKCVGRILNRNCREF